MIKSPDPRKTAGQPVKLPETASTKERTNKLEQLEARLLDQADALMKKGEVAQALQVVTEAMSCCQGHHSSRAFAIIAVALAHPYYQKNDKARDCLQRLKAASPESGYSPGGSCWVAALSEMSLKESQILRLMDSNRSKDRKIQTLTQQIEQLKAVDLELVQPDETAVEVP